MSIQTISRITYPKAFDYQLAPEHRTLSVVAEATSQDYSFDIDDEELARELLAPLPESLSDQYNIVVDADEFDALYRWFAS